MTTVGMDVQEEITAGSVAISRHILCLSCSAPIVMGFDAMVSQVIKSKGYCIGLYPADPTGTALAQAR